MTHEEAMHLLLQANAEIDALAAKLESLGVRGLLLHARWDQAVTTVGVTIDPSVQEDMIRRAPGEIASWSRGALAVPPATDRPARLSN